MKKKVLVIIASAIILLMAATALSSCGDENETATPDTATASETQGETQNTTSKTENITEQSQNGNENKSVNVNTNETKADVNKKTNNSNNNSSSGNGSANSKTNNNSSAQKPNGSSNKSNSSTNKKPDSSSVNSGNSSNDPNNGKTYHEAVYKTINHPAETKKVWVVDKAAYSYEEPIYETQERVICGNCNSDITDLGANGISQHMKEHTLNGTGKYGWHSEYKKIQVGTKTVEIPEQGHYETKVIKEAWTEKVLVREAGYY